MCNSDAILARLKFVSLLPVQFWPFLCHGTSGGSRERGGDRLSRRCVTWRGPELDTLLLAGHAGVTVKTAEIIYLLFLK